MASWDRLVRHARDPVYANGVALVANSAAASVLGFAFWLVAARRFSPEALGFGAAVVSAATLAALVGRAGFDACVIRYAPHVSDGALKKLLLGATLATILLTATVVGVILVLAESGVSSLAGLRSPLAASGFLLLATATAAAWVLDALFIAEQTALFALYRNLAFNVVKLGAPIFIALSLADFAVPIAWGVGLVVSLVVASALVPAAFRRRGVRIVGAPPTRRELVGYASKNYVLSVSEFLPGLVLPILVLDVLGPATNARFYLAWTIGAVGFLSSKAIAQSAFAALVREGPATAALSKAMRLGGLILAPFVVALLVLAGPILGLFGDAYSDAQGLLRLLAISVLPFAATSFFLAYLKARRAGWELTVLPASSLVAFLALTPIALAWGGIMGLGVAWLAVQILAGAYSTVRLVMIIRSPIPYAIPTLGRRPHEG